MRPVLPAPGRSRRSGAAPAAARLVAVASLLAAFAVAVPAASAAPGDTVTIDVYDQCANDTGTGYTAGDTLCRWINGNLNSSNSDWVEGDSVPERLSLKNLVPGSTYAVTFSYGTTKQGKHAYDFLTTFGASETWITAAERCENLDAAAGCLASSDVTATIPADPLALGYDTAFGTANGGRNFTLRGVTSASVTAGPTLVSGTYAGDSDTNITLTFTVGSLGSAWCGATTCNAAIWFGAHVAKEADWGAGTGAGSISGSPFHVALVNIDGAAVGARDNQMSADFSSPPPPTPGSLQLGATVTGGPVGYTGPFSLTYTCTAPSATTGTVSLASGATATITGLSDGSVCSVTQALPGAPAGYTWGTPAWTPAGQSVSISSGTTRSVSVVNPLTATPTPTPPPSPTASLSIAKGASLAADGPWSAELEAEEGETVWYRIVVTNTGGATLTGVTVADSRNPDGLPSACPAVPTTLAAGATWTCVYETVAIAGPVDNTATADSDQTAPASSTASVFGNAAVVLPATDVVTTPETGGIVGGLLALFAGVLAAALVVRRRRPAR
ncbi:MAG: hypothetical protein RL338_1763 [Chloroflexota bacterium]